jgi:hypothetical protein
MAENTNSRWWEFYFVRYFVGTVLGAIIVYVLTVSSDSALSESLVPGVTKEIGYPHLLLLAAYGLAYSYIASGPVLVLHATRSAFANREQTNFRLWFMATAILGVIVLSVVMWLKCINLMSSLVLLLAYLVLVIQMVPLLFVFQNRSEDVTRYYQNLSKKRSEEKTDLSRKEYVESYRHLREHGNAFLIVVFEIVLAICLWNLPKDAIKIFAPAIVIVWVLP